MLLRKKRLCVNFSELGKPYVVHDNAKRYGMLAIFDLVNSRQINKARQQRKANETNKVEFFSSTAGGH